MKRVMIVDDATFMRSILSKIVSELGYEVCGEASNGEEAILKASELKPDIITMDITMPDMDGIQAIKQIRSKNINSKIIVCSAMGQREMVIEAIRSGADDFIVKPFREDAIKSALERQSS